jgi:hypothetical protein
MEIATVKFIKTAMVTFFNVHEFKNSSPETIAKQFEVISFFLFIAD